MQYMFGNAISYYLVIDRETGKTYVRKTEKGARKIYNALSGHADMYQETTCRYEYITLASK